MHASSTDYHQIFWRVSAAFNGTGGKMATHEALKLLGEIIEHTGPMNPLHPMAVELREKIIYMDRPQKQPPESPGATTTVLAFAPIQKKESKTKKPQSKEGVTDGQTDRTKD